MNAELNIISGLEHLPAEKYLGIIRRVLIERGILLSGFMLYGKPIDLIGGSEAFKATERKAFLLEGERWQFHRACLQYYTMDIFRIQADWGLLDAERWITEVAAEVPITQAWVVNTEYDYWQNAEDPLEYISRGISIERLPKRSNGLPLPLEQTVIDISKNPGRRILRKGYVEAVGSPMWFGPGFWRLAGENRRRLIAEQWTKCTEDKNGLLRIQPSETPFSSSSDDSVGIQLRLRNLLFQNRLNSPS